MIFVEEKSKIKIGHPSTIQVGPVSQNVDRLILCFRIKIIDNHFELFCIVFIIDVDIDRNQINMNWTVWNRNELNWIESKWIELKWILCGWKFIQLCIRLLYWFHWIRVLIMWPLIFRSVAKWPTVFVYRFQQASIKSNIWKQENKGKIHLLLFGEKNKMNVCKIRCVKGIFFWKYGMFIYVMNCARKISYF